MNEINLDKHFTGQYFPVTGYNKRAYGYMGPIQMPYFKVASVPRKITGFHMPTLNLQPNNKFQQFAKKKHPLPLETLKIKTKQAIPKKIKPVSRKRWGPRYIILRTPKIFVQKGSTEDQSYLTKKINSLEYNTLPRKTTSPELPQYNDKNTNNMKSLDFTVERPEDFSHQDKNNRNVNGSFGNRVHSDPDQLPNEKYYQNKNIIREGDDTQNHNSVKNRNIPDLINGKLFIYRNHAIIDKTLPQNSHSFTGNNKRIIQSLKPSTETLADGYMSSLPYKRFNDVNNKNNKHKSDEQRIGINSHNTNTDKKQLNNKEIFDPVNSKDFEKSIKEREEHHQHKISNKYENARYDNPDIQRNIENQHFVHNLESLEPKEGEAQFRNIEEDRHFKLETNEETSPERKVAATSLAQAKQHILKHIELEEKMKHGENIDPDNIIKSRPLLEIGKDLHGETTENNIGNQRYVTISTSQKKLEEREEKMQDIKGRAMKPEETEEAQHKNITPEIVAIKENEKSLNKEGKSDEDNSDKAGTSEAFQNRKNRYDTGKISTNKHIHEPDNDSKTYALTQKEDEGQMRNSLVDKNENFDHKNVLNSAPNSQEESRVMLPGNHIKNFGDNMAFHNNEDMSMNHNTFDHSATTNRKTSHYSQNEAISNDNIEDTKGPSTEPLIKQDTKEQHSPSDSDQLLQQYKAGRSASIDLRQNKKEEVAKEDIESVNPIFPVKRPVPQPCKDDECEGNLMKDMKYKLGVLYDQLYQRGGNHMVEIYSTGCRSNDCSNAESSIKFDGMELSGKSEGINIAVLSYPGFEFLYSKTYNTGKEPDESEKMMQFLDGLQSPVIIFMSAQGEALSSMTKDAWKAIEKLAERRDFVKAGGSSLALLGYKGPGSHPWTQVNQKELGAGGAAIFTILGSDGEYVNFGGSGLTISGMIRELISEEAILAEAKDQYSRPQNKHLAPVTEPSLILKTIKSVDHKDEDMNYLKNADDHLRFDDESNKDAGDEKIVEKGMKGAAISKSNTDSNELVVNNYSQSSDIVENASNRHDQVWNKHESKTSKFAVEAEAENEPQNPISNINGNKKSERDLHISKNSHLKDHSNKKDDELRINGINKGKNQNDLESNFREARNEEEGSETSLNEIDGETRSNTGITNFKNVADIKNDIFFSKGHTLEEETASIRQHKSRKRQQENDIPEPQKYRPELTNESINHSDIVFYDPKTSVTETDLKYTGKFENLGKSNRLENNIGNEHQTKYFSERPIDQIRKIVYENEKHEGAEGKNKEPQKVTDMLKDQENSQAPYILPYGKHRHVDDMSKASNPIEGKDDPKEVSPAVTKEKPREEPKEFGNKKEVNTSTVMLNKEEPKLDFKSKELQMMKQLNSKEKSEKEKPRNDKNLEQVNQKVAPEFKQDSIDKQKDQQKHIPEHTQVHLSGPPITTNLTGLKEANHPVADNMIHIVGTVPHFPAVLVPLKPQLEVPVMYTSTKFPMKPIGMYHDVLTGDSLLTQAGEDTIENQINAKPFVGHLLHTGKLNPPTFDSPKHIYNTEPTGLTAHTGEQYFTPQSIGNIPSFNLATSHPLQTQYHNYNNDKCCSPLPVLNIPHPYVIHATEPINSNTPNNPEDKNNEIHVLNPSIEGKVQEVPPIATANHEQASKEQNPPDPVTNAQPMKNQFPKYKGEKLDGQNVPETEEKPSLSDPPVEAKGKEGEEQLQKQATEEPSKDEEMSPEFQKKLKEMLAEELTKKLNELKLSPDKRVETPEGRSLLKTARNLDALKIHQKGLDVSNRKREKGSTDLVDNRKEKEKTQSEKANYSDKEERFVHGDKGDFDNAETININTRNDRVKGKESLKESKDKYKNAVKEFLKGKTINGNMKIITPTTQHTTQYFRKPTSHEEDLDTDKDGDFNNGNEIKENKNSNDNVSNVAGLMNSNYNTSNENSVKQSNSKTSDLRQTPSNGNNKMEGKKENRKIKLKIRRIDGSYSNGNEALDSEIDHILAKDTSGFYGKNQSLQSDIAEEEERKLEKDDVDSQLNMETNFSDTNTSKEKQLEDAVSENGGKNATSLTEKYDEKYLDKENKNLEEELDKALKNESPAQEKELKKLVDNTEDLINENKQAPTIYFDAKDGSKSLDAIADMAESSLLSINDENKDASLCRRYRILKNGRKVKLKRKKKECVEKIVQATLAKSKPRVSNTQSEMNELMNPGYSTLPGADHRSRDLSFYFENNLHGHGGYRDNIYGDATGSNIFERGDYLNQAAKLLSDDERNTYQTAAEVIDSERMLEKSSAIRKKNQLLKPEKLSITSEEFRKDPRLTRTLKSDDNSNTSTLDKELKSAEFKW